MKLKRILNLINGGFASGNNNYFENYSGNVAYYVFSQLSGKEDKVYYFTCRNATFEVFKNGYIVWEDGQWLDGQFFGQFIKGKFWNGKINNEVVFNK